nr:hypothetical protein [Tanacetum cinerariifolium]
MAQQVIPSAQLVPRFHTTRRCNNYVVLQSISCSPKCKIVGQILLDHLLSYFLIATVDVLVMYLKQFWRTVSKVPGLEEMIKFMLNTQEFIYTVDIFRDILHLPVEILENLFVAPVNIETIEAFMNKVGYQGVVEKEIRAIDDFREYETVFMNVDVPMNQPIQFTKKTHKITIKKRKQSTPLILPPGDDRERERDAISKATLLSPALHKTALVAEAQENVTKVQEKLDGR